MSIRDDEGMQQINDQARKDAVAERRQREGMIVSDVVQFVQCPECDHEQADMGRNVCCEACGWGPMPVADEEEDDGGIQAAAVGEMDR